MLEKIWDLHDKVSDAIHSISRSRFLKSIGKNSKSFSGDGISAVHPPAGGGGGGGADRRNGFVFVKGLDEATVSMAEARSLNSIRTALEDLEDQLDFFHVRFLILFFLIFSVFTLQFRGYEIIRWLTKFLK